MRHRAPRLQHFASEFFALLVGVLVLARLVLAGTDNPGGRHGAKKSPAKKRAVKKAAAKKSPAKKRAVKKAAAKKSPAKRRTAKKR